MKFSVYVLALVAAAALAADGDNNNNDNNNDKSTATTGQKSSQTQASKTEQKSASATAKDDKSSTKSAENSKTTSKSDNKSDTKDNKSSDNKDNNKSDSKDNNDKKSSDKSEKKSSTTSKFSTSIDPRLPAGGVDLLTPEATTSTYIKLGEQATFVWNYTSLSVTPSAINIEAYCSQNRHYYTIAANQSAKETSVVWDTSQYSDNNTDDTPLINSNYQLYIYDADLDMNAVASAGYLASFNRYQFGIYSPQPYVPMDEFQCNGCQGKAKSAAPQTDMLVVKMLMAFCLIIVASFMHFTL
ncbi:hypothetical protein CJU90_6365 [Yarrowia sp. C11]|nr:hypothetical protein CJU90_6365 [Yarrowia sp. C11]KAG5371066.1 hypothetical protein CKK34_1206 [Yarrowia sp. E02]